MLNWQGNPAVKSLIWDCLGSLGSPLISISFLPGNQEEYAWIHSYQVLYINLHGARFFLAKSGPALSLWFSKALYIRLSSVHVMRWSMYSNELKRLAGLTFARRAFLQSTTTTTQRKALLWGKLSFFEADLHHQAKATFLLKPWHQFLFSIANSLRKEGLFFSDRSRV